MLWIAPTEKDTANAARGKRFWDAADQCHANSGFKPEEYSGGCPQGSVLGLIFMPFAPQRAKPEKATNSTRRGRMDEPSSHYAKGILYIPAEAQFDYLLNRLKAEDIGTDGNLWLTSL